jgi:hypothetical protein
LNLTSWLGISLQKHLAEPLVFWIPVSTRAMTTPSSDSRNSTPRKT